MAQQTDPRILGTEKIGKLLLQYSISRYYRNDYYFTLQHY